MNFATPMRLDVSKMSQYWEVMFTQRSDADVFQMVLDLPSLSTNLMENGGPNTDVPTGVRAHSIQKRRKTICNTSQQDEIREEEIDTEGIFKSINDWTEKTKQKIHMLQNELDKSKADLKEQQQAASVERDALTKVIADLKAEKDAHKCQSGKHC